MEDTFGQKPNLRSKGTRFGVHTGNSLKWSTQDHLAARKPGLIRKEFIRPSCRPLIEDGLATDVEYSINKKGRWKLAEDLRTEASELADFNARIYDNYRGYSNRCSRFIDYKYNQKTGEMRYDVTPKFEAGDHDVVAVVYNSTPHPRLRRQNASRIASTLDMHRAVRACRCVPCLSRMRKMHFGSNTRYNRGCKSSRMWFMSAERLRRKGPTMWLKENTNVTQFYEVLAPLSYTQFPMHSQYHNPKHSNGRNRLTKIKDLVKMSR